MAMAHLVYELARVLRPIPLNIGAMSMEVAISEATLVLEYRLFVLTVDYHSPLAIQLIVLP